MKAIFFKFRKNDLIPSSGKQIEFNKEYATDFFELESDSAEVKFTYRSLLESKEHEGVTLKVTLKLSPTRGDYKIYQNKDRSQDLKGFLIDTLHLSPEQNLDDYLIIVRQTRDRYLFSYVPKGSPSYELISMMNIDKVFGESWNEGRHTISSDSLQIIYFGTPGSGKSHKVQQSLEGVPEKCVFRTTFHPDSDYASFVGCYKPIVRQLLDRTALSKEELKAKLMEYKQTKDGQHPLHRFCAAHPEFANLSGDDKKEILASAGEPESKYVETYKAIACADELRKYMTDSDITYEFTPQVFTNAYVQAWKLQIEASEQAPAQAVYLVIEEINRGNCAQIFGDLFQLLDRNEEGFSTYKIRADKDLTMYLQKELGEGHEGIASGNLRLPANLHIIATMNTSDQSLFPMDSAFKRRWDWEYVPIDYGEEIASGKFEISIGDKKYRWIDFLKAVNKRILESTDSEDKQMGNFFIKQSVDEKVFKSKVMSYLWHEVCKDEYHTKNNFFRTNQEKEGEEFTFNELHEENGTNLLIGFMQYLGVKAQEDDPYQAGNSGTPNASEEGVES
jgi:type II restriction-modification system restriction subunit